MSFWLPALLAAAAGSASAPRTAGVLCVGRDVPPAQIAAAQASLEEALDGAGWSIAGAGSLGASVGDSAAGAAAVDAKTRAEVEALVDKARRHYYADELAAARRALDDAAARQAASPFLPVSDRIAVLLWRLTVEFAAGDAAQARAIAAEAIRLDPALEVPLTTFAPPVKGLVDAMRAETLASAAAVTFTGAPRGVEVLVDDRAVPAGAKAMLVPGRHWLRVRGPGLVERAEAIDVARAAEQRIAVPPLAVAFPEERVARLGRADGMAALARDAKVNAVAVVLLAPDSVKARWWAEGADAGSTFEKNDLAGAVTWLRERLAPPRKPVAVVPTPVATPDVAPAPTPTPVNARRDPAVRRRGGSDGGGGGAWIAAGPRAAFATRSVSATGFDPVSIELGGTGGAIEVGWERGRFTAGGGLALVTFAPSQTAAVVRGVRARAPGGTQAIARVAAGATFAGGLVRPSLGFVAERYQAPSMPIDEDVPLFVSQTRLAPELRVGSQIRAGGVELLVEIGASPVAVVSEDPAGTTGERPLGGPDFDARLRVMRRFAGAWSASLAWEGALRRAAFEGPSAADFDPVLEDGVVSETAHAFTLSLVRSF